MYADAMCLPRSSDHPLPGTLSPPDSQAAAGLGARSVPRTLWVHPDTGMRQPPSPGLSGVYLWFALWLERGTKRRLAGAWTLKCVLHSPRPGAGLPASHGYEGGSPAGPAPRARAFPRVACRSENHRDTHGTVRPPWWVGVGDEAAGNSLAAVLSAGVRPGARNSLAAVLVSRGEARSQERGGSPRPAGRLFGRPCAYGQLLLLRAPGRQRLSLPPSPLPPSPRRPPSYGGAGLWVVSSGRSGAQLAASRAPPAPAPRLPRAPASSEADPPAGGGPFPQGLRLSRAQGQPGERPVDPGTGWRTSVLTLGAAGSSRDPALSGRASGLKTDQPGRGVSGQLEGSCASRPDHGLY